MRARKKLLVAAVAASCALSAVSSDRAYFHADFYPAHRQEPEHAPIDEALSRIVPAPYRVMVDASIPETMILVWHQEEDWMSTLRRAVKPMGLSVTPDWSSNTIRVTWQQDYKREQVWKDNPVAQSMPATGIQQVKHHVPMSGRFEPAHEPAPVSADTPAPKTPSAQTMKPAAKAKPFVLKVRHTSRLPSPEEIGQLIRAVSDGGKLVLTGFSGVENEGTRIANANRYASRLRSSLLRIGFPDSSVVVKYRKRHPAKSRPRVEIAVVSV